MRWSNLFEDLEAQLSAETALEVDAFATELADAESAALTLVGRLRVGSAVRLGLASGSVVAGTVDDIGADWVLIATAPRDVLAPAWAVEWLVGAGRADPHRDALARSVSLGHIFRALAADETPVTVFTRAFEVSGMVLRAGADHVELAAAGGEVTAIPWTAIVSVLA